MKKPEGNKTLKTKENLLLERHSAKMEQSETAWYKRVSNMSAVLFFGRASIRAQYKFGPH